MTSLNVITQRFQCHPVKRQTYSLILCRRSVSTEGFYITLNLICGHMLGRWLAFVHSRGHFPLSAEEAFFLEKLRFMLNFIPPLFVQSTFKSYKWTLWDGFYFQESPIKTNYSGRCMGDACSALSWKWNCCRSFLWLELGRFQLRTCAIVCMWGGPVTGKQHARSAKALAGWNKVNKKLTALQSESMKETLFSAEGFYQLYLTLSAPSLKNTASNVRELPRSSYLVISMQT